MLARLAAALAIVAFAATTTSVVGQSSAVDEDYVHLDRADFVVGDRFMPPDDNAAWEPRSLPDHRPYQPGPTDSFIIKPSDPRPGEPVFAWYRLRMPELSRGPIGAQAMLLSLRGGEVAAFVNGALIEAPPSLVPAGDLAGTTRTVWFGVTSALQRRGGDVVHLRIALRDAQRYPTAIALSPVVVGAQKRLTGALKWERFWRDTLPDVVLAFTATIALLMFPLARRVGNRTLFYACATAAGSCAAGFQDTTGVWQWLTVGSLLVFGYRLAPALFGWAAWPVNVVDSDQRPWSIATAVGAALVMFVLANAPRADIALLLGYGLCLVQMTWIAWRTRTPEGNRLAWAHAFSVVALAREIFWPHLQGLDWRTIQLVPVFLVMGWFLVQRLAHALVESERLNAELDQRVRDKQAELEAHFAKVQQLTRDAAVVEERQRIMSDMHDGIGAQLISALSLAEKGDASGREVAAALRECIDDLRLTIDSLEPTDNDLLPALGNFRYRLEGRLKAMGVQLDWQAHELPPLANLTPRNVLHILRILQETFTNVLKHARASRIRVETGTLPEERQVFIRISDDGAGFSDSQRRGRGLANMERRAAAAGGVLSVTPTRRGTTVELRLAAA